MIKLRKLKEDTSDSEIITLDEVFTILGPQIEALVDKKVKAKLQELEMQNKLPGDDSGTYLKLPYRILPNIKDNVLVLAADARDGKLKAMVGGKWVNIKLE